VPEDMEHQPEQAGGRPLQQDNPAIAPTRFEPPGEAPRRRSLRIRAGAVGVAVLLALALLAGWFVLTARSVHISTDPDSADVVLSGGLTFKLADRFLVRSGEYRVQISNPGYHPISQPITVGTGQDQEFDFVLHKLPGHLKITTGPVAGAAIWIDGSARGRSPLMIDSIEAGTHAIRILADRYLPVSKKIEIEGKDIRQVLDVPLAPAWANVSLSSTPAGANVYVDDVLVGQTPITAEILQGTHPLRIQLSGYKAWHDQLTTTAGTTLTVPPVVLEPADAVLLVDSSPSRATVTSGGEYQGETPVELALPPDRRVTIRLFREGYKPARRSFSLRSGEKRHVHLSLQPELSRVTISAEPADAQLYVDGKPLGHASQVIELTTRLHRIRISKPGYVEYTTSITPRSGIAQKVRVRLKTLKQARTESVKPLIHSPGGQTLKLFRPNAEFMMGASRREPGRRANETLHKVRLARPFYLSIKEVSNDAFRRFQPRHSSGVAGHATLDTPDQPVVNVTWEEAALYCNWLSGQAHLPPFYTTADGKVTGFNAASTGYRLPTEAEWAWAARFQDNGRMLRFPWGKRMPPPAGSGNYADRKARNIVATVIAGYDDGYPATAPLASFRPNGKGLFDLGGNAAEWVHDFYTIASGMAADPPTDPLGPTTGQYHVIRGASWAHGALSELRLSFRDYGTDKRDDVGFRIARYVE